MNDHGDNGTIGGNGNGSVFTTDSDVLRNTFLVYGSMLLIIGLVFCTLRQIFPRPFTIRQWVPQLQSPLAAQRYGFLSWIWYLNTQITEDEILEHCGLDALCFLRTLTMGYKLCKMGAFQAIWLMPLYATSVPDHDARDPIVRITASPVPAGSIRLIGTVLATNIFILYTMYTILVEFQWFIEKRHKFLRQPKVYNYSVYIRNVPLSYRSNERLSRYLEHCLPGHDLILETRLRVKTTQLQRTVQQRDRILDRFEMALVREKHTGSTVTHQQGGFFRGTRVPSIEAYADEIRQLNQEVTQRIEDIERKIRYNVSQSRSLLSRVIQGDIKGVTRMVPGVKQVVKTVSETKLSGVNVLPLSSTRRMKSMPSSNRCDIVAEQCNDDEDDDDDDGIRTEPSSTRPRQVHFRDVIIGKMGSGAVSTVSLLSEAPSILSKGVTNTVSNTVQLIQDTPALLSKGTVATANLATKGMDGTMNLISEAPNLLQAGAAGLMDTALTMATGVEEEGDYYSGGFVIFKSLNAANTARQVVHSRTPHQMKVLAAPDPRDVFWFNVGLPHKELMIGRVISFGATLVTCFFWTAPTAFFSTLSSVEALKNQYSWVAELLRIFPWSEPILQLIAPLLLIIINSIVLPTILKFYSMFEGPVSGSDVEASSFDKQSFFMIVQTFFVSALAGGVMEGIEGIINDPLSAIDLLARTLPAQSTYFMQIAFVRTVIYLLKDNLRLVALLSAGLRSCIGPNTTCKQKQRVFLGLRPLSEPVLFEYAFNMSQICVLYFVVLLVYQAIAPLTVFILGFCFVLTRTAYLHNLIYIHPNTRDSGGRIWITFIRILIYTMFIAEFTTVGFLGLKGSTIATPLLVPLIITTFLFHSYLNDKHFVVTEGLASRDCIRVDMAQTSSTHRESYQGGRNSKRSTGPTSIMESTITTTGIPSTFRGAYKQRELRDKELFPEEGLDPHRAAALGLVPSVSSTSSSATSGDSREHAPSLPNDDGYHDRAMSDMWHDEEEAEKSSDSTYHPSFTPTMGGDEEWGWSMLRKRFLSGEMAER